MTDIEKIVKKKMELEEKVKELEQELNYRNSKMKVVENTNEAYESAFDEIAKLIPTLRNKYRIYSVKHLRKNRGWWRF